MFPENLQTTSGLSILLHGVISLPDATSYDKTTCEPVHEIYNNVVCATSKASDQPAHA